jgi:hypothetical protein
MSLSDKLIEASKKAASSACKLGLLLLGDKLSDKEKQQLITILQVSEEDPRRVSNVALAKVLRGEGFDISNSSVDRHRRGDCSCNRRVSA